MTTASATLLKSVFITEDDFHALANADGQLYIKMLRNCCDVKLTITNIGINYIVSGISDNHIDYDVWIEDNCSGFVFKRAISSSIFSYYFELDSDLINFKIRFQN